MLQSHYVTSSSALLVPHLCRTNAVLTADSGAPASVHTYPSGCLSACLAGCRARHGETGAELIRLARRPAAHVTAIRIGICICKLRPSAAAKIHVRRAKVAQSFVLVSSRRQLIIAPHDDKIERKVAVIIICFYFIRYSIGWPDVVESGPSGAEPAPAKAYVLVYVGRAKSAPLMCARNAPLASDAPDAPSSLRDTHTRWPLEAHNEATD